MSAVSFWGFLVAASLVSVGCGDLRLPRIRTAESADTTADPESVPARPKRPAVGRTDPAVENARFSEIRRNLRRLVVAEETFFAENGTYSEDLSHIGFKPDTNTAIRFLWLSREGWAASGAHAELPGRTCVVFVGQRRRRPTTLKYGRAGRVGTPVCDERRTPAPQPPPPQVAQRPAEPGTTPHSAPVDTGNALDILDPRVLMKVDLRNLAHSQETFFAMQGFYAKRAENLALQYLWHRDVQVKILSADAGSWAAKATHARFPGKSCVIWFGTITQRPRTDAQQKVEPRPGVPACDN